MHNETSLSESRVKLAAEPSRTVLEALEEKKIFLEGGCLGTGRCGRCRVRFLSGAPLPTAQERLFFTAQQLREGMRLACLHKCSREWEVSAAFVKAAETAIVTETVSAPEAQQEKVISKNTAEKRQKDRPRETEGQRNEGWMIGIDLGTTTIAMQGRKQEDGSVTAQWTCMNPQRRYGSDVISRMAAAQKQGPQELKQCVHGALEEGIRELIQKAGGRPPDGIFLAGNTVMAHLLMGLHVAGLAAYPFRPVTLEEQQLVLCGKKVTVLPGLSAFVGGDLLAGILFTGMHTGKEISLLIDLGTNGEIVLGNREKLLCTATAAGPAFEGGPGNLAPGTDMIAVIAQLLDAGMVDETGLLQAPWFETGILWKMQNGNAVRITQEEIRAVQMAKAAVYAGICVLVKEYGISFSEIDQVWLAGGFGYYLDVEAAFRIGLFPPGLKGRVKAAGNTSLGGTFCYGKSGEAGTGKQEAEAVQKTCRAVNLAQHPDFEEIYLTHMEFHFPYPQDYDKIQVIKPAKKSGRTEERDETGNY